MNALLTALAEILLVLFLFAIVFVFWGEPDLWDHMHNAALAYFERKE